MGEFNAIVLKEGLGFENLTLTDDFEQANYDAIKNAVGGWLQALNLTHPASGEIVCMWMDEDGKFKDGAQENIAANVLARIAEVGLMPGDIIVGNVVVTGLRRSDDPEEGVLTGPIPESWERVIARLDAFGEGRSN